MLTTEQAIEWEAEALADAIASNVLENNDQFLERYCSEKLREALLPLTDETDRAWVLDSHLHDWRELSGFDSGEDISILLGEIEVQFDGEPEDYFSEPDDWAINGDLAYCVVQGVTWTIDVEAIREDVADVFASAM